jgi:hypothetical protein
MLERLTPEWWLEELLSRGWEYRKAKLFEHYMGLVRRLRLRRRSLRAPTARARIKDVRI